MAYDAYTKLCSHFDGADGATSYSDPIQGAATFVGGAQLDTAQKKFGESSLYLDGSDKLTYPDSADWSLFDGNDFTIDFWVRFGGNPTDFAGIVGQCVDGASFWGICYKWSTNVLQLYAISPASGYADSWLRTTYTFSLNTWYHVAFVRNGASGLIAIDGDFKVASLDGWVNLADKAAVLMIGYYEDQLGYFQGWLDELRISKGIARWTEDFTPPTAPYSEGFIPRIMIF